MRSHFLRSTASRIAGVLLCSALATTVVACGSDDDGAPSSTTATSSAEPPAPSSSAPPPPTTTKITTAVEPSVTATARPSRPTKSNTRAPAPKDVLTGKRVRPGPLIAAKIDNTSAGFPQFGVARADIVYVEQVEGGLTRLIALFHSTLPDEVGPIRSVRSTDSELLPSYGSPGLAFSGGAGGPLTRLAETSIIDLSPDRAGAAYWRSEFGDGTHNLHVDLSKLAADHDVADPKSPGFHFDAALPKSATTKVTDISVTMQASRTGFEYTNGRYEVRHFDNQYVDHDGTLVRANNVLVQRVRAEPDGTVDSAGAPSYLSHTVGTGDFTLYRDGRAIEGTWTRKKIDGPTSFVGASGGPVPFKPGKTWVVLAPPSASISTN